MDNEKMPCDKCGFLITQAEYAKNNGLCFECADEEAGYPGAMPWETSHDVRGRK